MSLHAEIEKVAKQYPESRSAVLPALRLAQEEYGWLSREALEQVGEALGLTPAYCMSIASFYDMFHLEPVGTAPGETTGDGAITLRAVECLGGCATPTIVAVDHRFREWVAPDDVPAIVQELRSAG